MNFPNAHANMVFKFWAKLVDASGHETDLGPGQSVTFVDLPFKMHSSYNNGRNNRPARTQRAIFHNLRGKTVMVYVGANPLLSDVWPEPVPTEPACIKVFVK
jgi:hypothetical protein